MAEPSIQPHLDQQGPADAPIQTQPTEAVPAAPGPDALAAAPPEVGGQRSALGIVLPLLPRYAKGYVVPLLGSGEKDWRVGAITGLLMASFSAMQFLFAPVWGRVSD